ncbi:hypothetical protein CPS_3746 [Colwellia psychrerythraea 34H]|uniref:Uncharacterized protein n=1 Tax=Colwellia psychrerythraea (strain 34H / ATCC BAA-681) TaxID=167879 RepID=Q47XQ7_COLP3|nr:hypothetical protein CPS_3746 [Colwellia psychrerythraea 34H]
MLLCFIHNTEVKPVVLVSKSKLIDRYAEHKTISLLFIAIKRLVRQNYELACRVSLSK